MKRNLIGALIIAGGLTLSTSVTSFAQTAPFSTDAFKAQLQACSLPALASPPANLTGEVAREATSAYTEASTTMTQLVGKANFKIDEIAAEATDEEDGAATATADLTAELTAFVTETCQALAEIRSEYNATIAELVSEAITPENDQNQVDKQDQEKPKVKKPEHDKQDSDKQEEQKREQEKSDSRSDD